MRSTALYATLGMLLSVVPAWGQLAPPMVKKGEELVPPLWPAVYQAKAAEENGEVVVRVWSPSWRTGGDRLRPVDLYVWEETKTPFILGKKVSAYSQAGKLLSKDAVLKALAKQVAVPCFVRRRWDDPERPDPFYAALYRDDAVLLVIDSRP